MTLRPFVLSMLALAALTSCGADSDHRGPFIEVFRAEPGHLSPAEPVELIAEFGGGAGRIEPELGTVQPGARVRVGPFASGMTYRLVVSDGIRTVERELKIPLRYRHRIQSIPASPTARVDHSAAVLPDGRVLIFGGRSPTFTAWTTSEVYDPATGHFTPSGDLSTTRWSAAWAGVGGGRIVLAGGETNAAGFQEATRVLVWSADSGEWTASGNLLEFRIGHSATRLPLEGNVLLVAGGDFYLRKPERVTPVELFDVDRGTSRPPEGAMVEARLAHTATRLVDGRILLAGGLNAFTNVEVSSAEIYDPATEQFSVACVLSSERYAHAAVALPDGRALMAGGFGLEGVTTSAEVFDPRTGQCTATGGLHVARAELRLVMLATGEVAAIGGRDNDGQALASIETWDPVAGTWTLREAALAPARVGHSASVLHDGRVLVLGGGTGSGAMPLQAAALYD
jgi:hypothetical protein